MRKILFVGVMLIFSLVNTHAQCCQQALEKSLQQVDSAFRILEIFRSTIQMYIEIDKQNQELVYGNLYNALRKTGAPILISNIDSSYFTKGQLHSVKVINNNSSDSIKFIEISKFLNLATLDYELLLFHVYFHPLDSCCAAEDKAFADKYNNLLTTASMRMGRIIQHAMNKDELFVTNNSVARLDFAIAELRNHKYQQQETIIKKK